MSANLAKQKAIKLLRQHNPVEPGFSILSSLVEKIDEATVQLVYDAAWYALKDYEKALARTIPIVFHVTLIDLADDIADGDCDYMDNPIAQGVTAVYSLFHLFNQAMSLCKVQDNKIFDALFDVGLSQHQELATDRWDFAAAKSAAVGLAGRQYEAYFRIAAIGSGCESQLVKCGFAHGIACHIANDVLSKDDRLYDLQDNERALLINWALELSQSSPLPFDSAEVYVKPLLQTLVNETQLNLR